MLSVNRRVWSGSRLFWIDIVQLIRDEADDPLGLHVLDGHDAGQRLVAAGRGQQGDVIAEALVAVGPAEIEHLGAAHFTVALLQQIGFGGDEFDAGDVQRPFFGRGDDDQDRHISVGLRSGLVRLDDQQVGVIRQDSQQNGPDEALQVDGIGLIGGIGILTQGIGDLYFA